MTKVTELEQDERLGAIARIGTLGKPRRRRQRGRGKTKDLMSRTIARLVRFQRVHIS